MSLMIVTIIAKYSVNNSGIDIQVKPSKDNYLLGEVVKLEFDITNNSSKDVYHRGLSLSTGGIIVLIASEDGIYKPYRIPDSANARGVLKAGETKQFTENVLYNDVPNLVNIHELKDRIIISDYAFPKSGVYYIKVKLLLPEQDGVSDVETPPFTVVINEPTGEDLKVWKLMKADSKIGYFMQSGEVLLDDKKKVDNFLVEVESIINTYPETTYATLLKKSKEKHQAVKEKINKAREDKQKQDKLREQLLEKDKSLEKIIKGKDN